MGGLFSKKKQTTERETEKQQLSERVTEKQQTTEEQLPFVGIKEELNVVMEKRISCCNVCLYNDIESESELRVVRKVEGVYSCYGCELILCENCVKGHESHKFCVHKESEERERVREELINSLMEEEGREDKLEEENVCIYDRVNVKHELDEQDCWITGLCGLDNRKWVVCDNHNSCIKIFECGSNVFLRYIRIGSEPYDVTEIHNSTVQDSASSSNIDISETDSSKPDKQCLLAVTLPGKRHILFIDVNKTPAIEVKTIRMENECFRIEFCDDKVFTLCKEENPSLDGVPWSVYVMSTDGVQLSTIQTGVYGRYIPHLAVVPGIFYVTDRLGHKVKCIQDDGKDISEKTKEVMWPRGIGVDPDHNIFIIAKNNNKIYKVDFDLDGPPRPLLFDQSTEYLDSPRAMCFYADKIFASHDWLSPLGNIVTVVRLV